MKQNFMIENPKDDGQLSVAGKNINWYFNVSNLVILKSAYMCVFS